MQSVSLAYTQEDQLAILLSSSKRLVRKFRLPVSGKFRLYSTVFSQHFHLLCVFAILVMMMQETKRVG